MVGQGQRGAAASCRHPACRLSSALRTADASAPAVDQPLFLQRQIEVALMDACRGDTVELDRVGADRYQRVEAGRCDRDGRGERRGGDAKADDTELIPTNQRVEVGDDVVAEPSRTELEHVAAGAAGESVVAGAAIQHVVAGPAFQYIIAGAAAQRVVAGAANQRVGADATDDVVGELIAGERHAGRAVRPQEFDLGPRRDGRPRLRACS